MVLHMPELEARPSRAHHCREIGHCVRKMDPFCPYSYGLQQLSLTKKRHYALIATGERGMSRGIYIDGLQVWRR